MSDSWCQYLWRDGYVRTENQLIGQIKLLQQHLAFGICFYLDHWITKTVDLQVAMLPKCQMAPLCKQLSCFVLLNGNSDAHRVNVDLQLVPCTTWTTPSTCMSHCQCKSVSYVSWRRPRTPARSYKSQSPFWNPYKLEMGLTTQHLNLSVLLCHLSHDICHASLAFAQLPQKRHWCDWLQCW